MVWVEGSGFKVSDFRVLGLRVQGSGFKVQGLRVLGLRV